MKLPVDETTVSAMVVVAVVVPEVPVIVTFEVPTVAVALAVKVITLVLVVGLVANAAVTPAGNPVAARVTLPVKVPVSVTVMVSLAVLPCVTDNAAGDAASVKPDTGVAVTVSEMEVEAVSVPEVPVMVTVDVPAVAVALAANVTTLLPVVGLVPNVAVTPEGNPEAARVTLPVNGLTSVTVIVSVPLAPCAIDNVEADGFNVKLPAVVTVSATVVLAVVDPEMPVMVTVDVPAVAVLLAVNVATLVPVVGLVPNAAVTPLGRPEAASVTLPVNPFTSVTVIVSVALPAWATDRVEAEGDSAKVGVEASVPITIPRPLVPT